MFICLQEIAIRVFRTAHELAMHTVAIYSYEDRMSAHRQKVRDVTPSGLLTGNLANYPSPRLMRHTALVLA